LKKLNVAVVGFGHLGKWHADKVQTLGQSNLSYIVEPFSDSAKVAQDKFPECQVVSNVKEVIGKIDAAIVVTPTSFHFEVVKELLENDIHVFCEKPMTSTPEQARSIGNILKEKKSLIFQVGHSERCHQIWERRDEFKSYFENAPTVRINRVAAFKGRATDVDVVQDLMIHDIDLLFYLFRETPISLKSTGYKIRTDKWDHVSTDFYFKSGLKANITVGRNHVKEMRDVEVINEEGTLFFDLFSNELIVGPGRATEEFTKVIPYEKRDHLYIEQEKFYNSILKGEEVFVNFNDGLIAVEVIDKVLESLSKNTEVFI